jgi:hypothetical protein
MSSTAFTRTLATAAVVAGLLAAAAPAGAAHDGTSNTMFGVKAAPPSFSLPEVDDEVGASGIIAILIGAVGGKP